MQRVARQLHKLVKRGLLIPSDDFDVEKLPDGRHRVHLRAKPQALTASPAPPPPTTCPASITAVFSGITVDCGCIDWTNGSIHAFNATDVDANHSYSMSSSNPCNFYSNGDHDIVQVSTYFSTGCSGLINALNYQDALVIFFTDGYWRVWYQSSFNIFNFLFYARVASSIGVPPTSTSNQITSCGSTPWNDDPDFETLFGSPPGGMQAIGHGGTLSITA
jgi:hypothetical protein